jgi:hypothetical protein
MDNFIVGAPSLIGVADYSDTFTVTNAPRSDGLYNNNSGGAYNVESSNANPQAVWSPISNFSFNSPGTSTGPDITMAATGNPGAETGFAQSGSGDFSFAYGLRDSYVAAVDAILPLDRLDISSMPAPGANVSSATQSLSVFFRKDSSTGAGIALYNGSTETAVTDGSGTAARTGIDDANWHNFAVHFNAPAGRLGIYVDGEQMADVDLATFAGGIYRNYLNSAVGTGGAGFDGIQAQWMDNFMVGLPGPAIGGSAETTPQSQIAIARAGAQIQITWSEPGTLEESGNVSGPYTPVPGASSGYSVAPSESRKFFRLKN